MDTIINFINSYLGPISTIIGIVTFIPILYIWWDVYFGRRKRIADWYDRARKSNSQKTPSILIVDLLDKGDIRTQVESFRNNEEPLSNIPSDRIFVVTRTKHISPEDIAQLVVDIKSKASEILSAGTDTLHLFYAGPIVPSIIIGGIFSNTFTVILYQHSQGTYVNWGPLKHINIE